MGAPSVCGFTNLPIENGADIMFMVVKKRPWTHLVMGPLDMFEPVTTLYQARYNEDYGIVGLTTEQCVVVDAALRDIGGAEYTLEDGMSYINDLPSDCFAWMMLREAYDNLLPTLEYMHFSRTDYKFKPIIEEENRLRDLIIRTMDVCGKLAGVEDNSERYTKALDLQRKTPKPHQNNNEYTTAQDEEYFTSVATRHLPCFAMGEGNRTYFTENLAKRIFAAPPGTDFHAIGLEFLPFHRLYMAMKVSRRAIFPINRVGPQQYEPENHRRIAAFMVQHVDSVGED